ncbi:hypothetical protein FBU31_001213, partial [Coemansia sp. 'formosensis']
MADSGNAQDMGLYIGARPLIPSDDMTDSDSDLEVVERRRGIKRGPSRDPHHGSSDEGLKVLPQPYWRSRAPLLPQRMATVVSQVSGATRLSLEIAALFWEAIFDTVSESTNSGIWLGTAAWEEVRSLGLAAASVLSPLSSLNPQIVSRLVGSTTAAGYSAVNQSLAAAERVLEGGFAMYSGAVNMGLHAAGEYVRFIDAIFGSTDTSRVLASFVHMCRREAFEKNPEIRALIDEHGAVGFGGQVLKTMVAWICLQVVTHGRARPYRMRLVYANTGAGAEFCPRKFIDSNGKPLPAAPPKTPANMTPAAAEEAGSSDEYCALSDQEGSSHLDPDWDQRLMEALRKLSLHNEQKQKPDDVAHDVTLDAQRSRSSLWNTLLAVRESAAAAAQEHGGSDSSSDSEQPVGRGVSAPFESAPASLVSSPQFPATPGTGRMRRASTAGGEEASTHDATLGDIPALDGLPPADSWMQEFPRKPLLFNLARFISVASAAYGHSFMQVLGLGHGMIDARALIDEFGDYEVGRLSHSASMASMDPPLRAQPMSSYHTHAAFHAARPDSQRTYERRHYRAPSPRLAARRAPVRRHRRRRPLSEHPNHHCFARHTGIPLGDLLFSSYVPPIVPGVTRAASAQAEAVERKLRHKAKKRDDEP